MSNVEWEGHALIAQNICPLHEDQPADSCDHGCTWLTPITDIGIAHECGYTFREGLGYLPNDVECEACRQFATDKWKSTWLGARTEVTP